MNNQEIEALEARLTIAGRTFQYPPTPGIAGMSIIMSRAKRRTASLRLTWAMAVMVMLLLVLLAVPPVRAQILEFIQIGIVRIFLAQPSPTAPLPTWTEPSVFPPTTTLPVPSELATGTPRSSQLDPTETGTVTLLPSLLDLAGETTLEEARSRLAFPIFLPIFPPGLGQPDHVFLQSDQGQMLVLVWLSPDEPEEIELSLHSYSSESTFATKWEPQNIEETRVNGQPAIWAEGPYPFRLRSGEFTFDRLIEGHVLIWTVEGITYRLETDLSLVEALKIAESLTPLDDQQPQPSAGEVQPGANDGTNPH